MMTLVGSPNSLSSGGEFLTPEEAVQRAWPVVKRTVKRRMSGDGWDEQDEAIQESLIQVARGYHRVRVESAFYGWVRTVTDNTINRHLKKKIRRRLIEDTVDEADGRGGGTLEETIDVQGEYAAENTRTAKEISETLHKFLSNMDTPRPELHDPIIDFWAYKGGRAQVMAIGKVYDSWEVTSVTKAYFRQIEVRARSHVKSVLGIDPPETLNGEELS